MLFKNREKFKHFSVKVGILFSKIGLSPNQWTLFTLIPALLVFYFLTQNNFLYSAVFFGITAFIDLIDGSVARVTGRVTKKGAYLDTIIDRYVEFIVIIGLLFASLPGIILPLYAWLFIYLFGSMMTTYVKASAFEKKLVETELKGGILERAERLIILFVGIVLANVTALYLVYIIIILAVLSNITAFQRIIIALKSNNE